MNEHETLKPALSAFDLDADNRYHHAALTHFSQTKIPSPPGSTGHHTPYTYGVIKANTKSLQHIVNEQLSPLSDLFTTSTAIAAMPLEQGCLRRLQNRTGNPTAISLFDFDDFTRLLHGPSAT